MKRLILVLALAFTVGCASTIPANLSPQATIAFQQTRIQKVLDLIRDTVDDGTKTTPPVFSVLLDVEVATWHQSAITIVHDARGGWRVTLATSVEEFRKSCGARCARLAPYFTLARTLIQEVR